MPNLKNWAPRTSSLETDIWRAEMQSSENILLLFIRVSDGSHKNRFLVRILITAIITIVVIYLLLKFV